MPASHPPRSVTHARAAFAAAAIAFGALLTSCGKPAPAKPASPAAEQTYTVRGEVFELPDPANPRTAFRVHHEAIDNWVGSAGKVIGMSAMTMEFEPGPGISLEGLSRSDKIEMVFEVWWEGQPPLRYPRHRITRLTRLPADTVLEFRPAKPPAE